MPCLFAVIALLFPRVLIVVLWLFTNWFSGVFTSNLWPVLGFFFLPVSTLWYSVVIKNYGGEWSPFTILLLVIAILIDMGSWKNGYRKRNRR